MAQELPPVAPGEVIEAGTFGNPVLQRLADRFANAAARDAAGAGVAGDICYVEDIAQFQVFYTGLGWQPIVAEVQAGNAITVTGTPTIQTVNHGDTSAVGNVDGSEGQFIQDMTFDTYGHVQTAVLASQRIDTVRSQVDTNETTPINIGTGVAVGAIAFTTPATGRAVYRWQAEIQRTSGGGTPQPLDELTFIVRRGGANVDQSGWQQYSNLDPLTFWPTEDTNGWTFTGSYGRNVPAETETWDLLVAKTSNEQYAVRRFQAWIDWVRD